MCTYMDKCRCAVVIWLWHKFFRFWGKLCAMRCPSYFRRFPFRPRSPRFRLAPSQRSSPQAISHGFPSVHPAVASVSLPPNVYLPPSSPQAISHGFPSVHPACRSLSSELSPSYFPRFPVRPPCPCTLPWLPPNGALPKLFPTVSRLSTLLSLRCRSPLRQSKLNENPSIENAFGKK